MSLQEIDLPEVKAMHQNARFYKEGDVPFVEISYVGTKDTIIKKVKPEHMARFRDQWTAFCDGGPLKKREGTDLTALNGVDQPLADKYINQNVHTVEELAALSDGQCQALGHGTLTLRKQAIDRLRLKEAEIGDRARKALSDASASIGPRPAETYASKSDLDELKQMIAGLAQQIAAKPKPGRPKKAEAKAE